MKKRLVDVLVLTLGIGAATVGCYANTLNLASSASETTNGSGLATVNVTNLDHLWDPALAGSSWVSYVQSGSPYPAGFVLVPNGTSVTFTDTFTISGTPTGGMLYVMADDTASVTLNGTLMESLASSVGNTYIACSNYKIGCLTGTTGVIDLDSALVSGVNTLSFDVQQVHGEGFGLDYVSSIAFNPAAAIPEPSTFALLGLPLVLLSLLRRKRTT